MEWYLALCSNEGATLKASGRHTSPPFRRSLLPLLPSARQSIWAHGTPKVQDWTRENSQGDPKFSSQKKSHRQSISRRKIQKMLIHKIQPTCQIHQADGPLKLAIFLLPSVAEGESRFCGGMSRNQCSRGREKPNSICPATPVNPSDKITTKTGPPRISEDQPFQPR